MAGKIGYGCDLQISTDGGNTYSSIGKVHEDIPLPNFTAPEKDTSYIQQANAYRTNTPGMAKPGKCKVTCLWEASAYANCLNNLRVSVNGSGQAIMYKIVGNDKINTANSTLVGAGWICDLGGKYPMDDDTVFDVEIQWSGQPTFTQAT